METSKLHYGRNAPHNPFKPKYIFDCQGESQPVILLELCLFCFYRFYFRFSSDFCVFVSYLYMTISYSYLVVVMIENFIVGQFGDFF